MLITLPSGEKRLVLPELSVEERRDLIKKSIDEFLRLLIDSQGENLFKVVLYGSVARNEEQEGSDIDLFILLKNYDLDKKKRISDIAFDIAFDLTTSRIPISPFIIGIEEYMQIKKRDFFFHEVEKEGVVLYDADA